MNSNHFKKICGSYATGIAVLTTTHMHENYGITINSFSSVSINPPLVLFCIDKKTYFNTPLKQKKTLAINILSESQQEISNRFANSALTNQKRFKGLNILTEFKHPVFEDTLAVLIAEIKATHDGGDHWIYVAEISSGQVFNGSPLIYYGGSYSNLSPNE